MHPYYCTSILITCFDIIYSREYEQKRFFIRMLNFYLLGCKCIYRDTVKRMNVNSEVVRKVCGRLRLRCGGDAAAPPCSRHAAAGPDVRGRSDRRPCHPCRPGRPCRPCRPRCRGAAGRAAALPPRPTRLLLHVSTRSVEQVIMIEQIIKSLFN